MVVVVWTIIQSKGRLILLVSETVNQKYLLKLKCVCEGMQKNKPVPECSGVGLQKGIGMTRPLRKEEMNL